MRIILGLGVRSKDEKLGSVPLSARVEIDKILRRPNFARELEPHSQLALLGISLGAYSSA